MAGNAIRIRGERELRAKLKKLGSSGGVQRDLARALFTQGELLMTESKREVPVDTGALRSSGTVDPPTVTGSSVSVEMGYGGVAVGYAVEVHEKIEIPHRVGKAKYLEDPFRRLQPDILQALGREFASGVRKRV